MIDEGIAVFLDGIGDFVSVDFFFGDRVVFSPFEIKILSPGGQRRIGVFGKGVETIQTGHFVFVASDEIEIRSGEIALVFVDDFKNGAAISGRGVARS